jgi:hypothetical protein
MDRQSGTERSLAMSYLTLRRAIGWIGILLPFVLAIGKICLEGPGLQGSISAYYYTVMRNVLVGSLCAIGVFLMSYRYRKDDKKNDIIAAFLAGIFAIGVVLFPTAPANPTRIDSMISIVHVVCAAFFFLTLAYISLFLFTKTHPDNTLKPGKPLGYLSLLMVTRTRRPLERRKKWRNVIYRFCGYAIIVCIVLLGLVAIPSLKNPVEHLHPVFWLESVAVVAFGFSWLVKGETLLKDRKSRG